jgi:murein DD-endopeptidase MepM/ murein hydrolase activator NlpD
VLARNGRVTIPQRFAVDWIGVDDEGRAVRGDFRKSANEDWVGFGADVIAVADGVVREARDGILDHAPFVEPPPPTAVTLEAVGGNYVLLELSRSRFAYYAHFQRNSVAVKPGDRVVRGQVLGRLGNSGNTNAPHLHFHVGDGPSFNDSEGLPFVLDTIELLGKTTAEYAVAQEGAPATVVTPERHRRKMPLHGMVVRFR